MINKILWAVLFIGMIIGPVTDINSRYFSGNLIRTITLKGPITRPWGSIERIWQTPVTVRLEPSMNPVAFDFSSQINPGRETVDLYRAELYTSGTVGAKGAIPVWTRDWKAGFNFRRGRPSSPIHSNRLHLFNIPEAGDYQFNMMIVDDNGAADIKDLALKVKANVTAPDSGMVSAGYIMFLGPLLFMFIRAKLDKD